MNRYWVTCRIGDTRLDIVFSGDLVDNMALLDVVFGLLTEEMVCVCVRARAQSNLR